MFYKQNITQTHTLTDWEIDGEKWKKKEQKFLFLSLVELSANWKRAATNNNKKQQQKKKQQQNNNKNRRNIFILANELKKKPKQKN